jgi:HlyD family secretion protein
MAARVSMSRLAAGSACCFGIMLATAGLWGGRREPSSSSTSRAVAGPAPATAEGATVHALARLEPVGGIVVVGARPGTRIEGVLVAEGDKVKVGQTLGVIEGHEEARCQLALAEARKADAVRRRARERNRLALERDREDRLRRARLVMLDNIKQSLRREDARFDDRITTFPEEFRTQMKQSLDELKSRLDQLRIEEHKTIFEREQSRIDEDVLSRKRALEDEAVADGGTEDQLLDRQIDLARATLAATTIKAPIAGTVLDVMVHSGEISSGPLLAVGDSSAVEAVAEVDQADIELVGEGDDVSVTILGKPVSGKVTRIGRLVGRNQLTNIDPRMPQDLRVVKVNVRLDRAEPAARLMNLQVEVMITPRKAQQ